MDSCWTGTASSKLYTHSVCLLGMAVMQQQRPRIASCSGARESVVKASEVPDFRLLGRAAMQQRGRTSTGLKVSAHVFSAAVDVALAMLR